MIGVVEGFTTIAAVISLGYLLAVFRVFDLTSQEVLARLAFLVATPALLITVLQSSDAASTLSRNMVATSTAMGLTAGAYVALSRWFLHQGFTGTIVGALCSIWVNAGNLGVPVAAYVLGDAALVAPVLLLQLLVLQPVALALMGLSGGSDQISWWRLVAGALFTPLTIATLIGLGLSISGKTLPQPIDDPLSLVGATAVPGVLLAYGISLRLGPRPGVGGGAANIAAITALKVVVQPTLAYGIGRFVLQMDGAELLGVTVLGALPTAHNVFVISTRYNRMTEVARDTIFTTTLLSLPAILVVVALLT